MAFSVEMPALGESVTEGTVTRWLKQEGDTVEVDEPLLEVSTDKVDTEIPSPAAGVLQKIVAAEDDTVEVGGELAVIGDADDSDDSGSEDTSDADSGSDDAGSDSAGSEAEDPDEAGGGGEAETSLDNKVEPAVEQDEETVATNQAPQSKPAKPDDRTEFVTPLMRKLANEHDVDLSAVTGSGVGGRIRRQGVLAAAEQAKSQPEREAAAPAASSSRPQAPTPSPELAALRGTVKKASRIRQITATKTRESLQETAQLTQVHEVDMSRIVALRARAKASFAEREGVNLTYLPFFAKAVVEALKAHPNVNASYDEGSKEITYHAAEHLGIAVDTERGLLFPVIHDAGDLSLAGLARAIKDIADKARGNGLKLAQLSGGTFTITNFGSQGALIDTPILVPPQSAMLGTGAIVKRPVVVSDELGGDTIAVRSIVYLPLTYDHRLVDGADAGRFLTTVKQRLEEASFEAELGLAP